MIGPKTPKPTPAEARAAHALVDLRALGVCEGCGRRPKSDRHHRRKPGRIDAVDNLLDLCGGPGGLPGGNHSGCHGIAHSGRNGYLLGWAVKAGNDPAEIPVYHLGRDVFTLRDAVIPHALAVQKFVDAGVVADRQTYLAWFDEMHRVAVLEGAIR